MNEFLKKKPVYMTFFIFCIAVLMFETYRYIKGDIGILDVAPFGGGLILLLGMYAYKLGEKEE